MPQLKSEDVIERERAIKAYIDLCNEELFYFKYKYLPEEIVEEWLEGMIYYLPTIKNGKVVEESKHYLKDIDDETLEEYPQVRNAFEIRDKSEYEDFDYEKRSHRKILIENIKSNLKNKNSNELNVADDTQRLLQQ